MRDMENSHTFMYKIWTTQEFHSVLIMFSLFLLMKSQKVIIFDVLFCLLLCIELTFSQDFIPYHQDLVSEE